MSDNAMTIEVEQGCTITIQPRGSDAPLLTPADYARLEGIAWKTYTSRACRGLIQRVDTGVRGANGKPVYGIPLSELSPAARQRWQAEQRAIQAPVPPTDASLVHEDLYVRDAGTAPRSAASPSRRRCAVPAPPLAGRVMQPLSRELVPLTASGQVDEAALVAMGRAKAVHAYRTRMRAVLDLEEALRGLRHGQKLDALADVARRLNVPVGTLRRWHADYTSDGPAALVPQWGKSEGSSSVPAGLRAELLAAWHAPIGMTFAQAFRYAVAWCRERGVVAPSLHAVRRFLLKHANPQLKTALRQGKKSHQQHHRYHLVRDPNELPVNGVWCGDTRTADVHVLMPDGSIGRPRLCQFIDIRSGRLVGHTIRQEMTSDGIASALRRGILGWTERRLDGQPVTFEACGLPEVLYLDNGKDYTGGAMRLDLSPEAAATIYTTLGVKRCLAIPFHAWSKPMEAAFSAMAQDENLLCGYCGRNAVLKPELLKRLAEKRQLLTLEQYAAWYAGWVAERNAHHVLGHLREHPPMAYYEGVERRLVDPAQLDTLLLRATNRVIQNHGIELPGLGRYMSEEPSFILLIGSKVEVRWTPDDPSAIRVIHPATGARFTVPRVPGGDSWAMIFGGEPSEQFTHAQRVRSVQRRIIGQAAAEVAQAVNVRYLDPTGTYRAAAVNRLVPAPATAESEAEAMPALESDARERLRIGGSPAPAAIGAESPWRRKGRRLLAERAELDALASGATGNDTSCALPNDA